MLEKSIRKHYQKIAVDPILNTIPAWLLPVHITLFSCLIGIAFIPTLLLGDPWLAVLILLMSGYLDTLDGSLARRHNQSSDLGAVFDIMSDRVVECAIMLAFFLRSPITDGLYVLFMLIASLLCITSFLVVGIFEKKNSEKSFFYSPGLIERTEAFSFFVAMVLMPSYFIELAIIYSILVLWTSFVRVKEFSKI